MSTSRPKRVTYSYSVKLGSNSKGRVIPAVSVYSNDMETARKQAIEQFHKTVEELREKGLTVAMEGKA